MFRCITEIKCTQVAKNGDGRNAVFLFDFCHKFTASTSWADLTNECKVVFPKNIYVRDAQGTLIPLGGANSKKWIANLFQRGDKIEISYGYYLFEAGVERKVINTVFKGYISSVGSKIPIELECEDNVWLLKQIPCRPQVWPKEKTVEDLIKNLLIGHPFTVKALSATTVGNLIIQNESVAQLLSRVRKDYGIEAYFVGDELRVGSIVYVESEVVSNTFVFQQNIVSDSLNFQRKEDVKLSVVAESINTKQGAANKKGQAKTVEERLTVLVYYDSDGIPQKQVKVKGKEFPANLEGERRKLFFPNIDNSSTLAQKGLDEMEKYYYTGFRGKFVTFAYPFVKLGDTVVIKDRVLPDRDGSYRVKSVIYSGGVEGHRQEIELHYKLTDKKNFQ